MAIHRSDDVAIVVSNVVTGSSPGSLVGRVGRAWRVSGYSFARRVVVGPVGPVEWVESVEPVELVAVSSVESNHQMVVDGSLLAAVEIRKEMAVSVVPSLTAERLSQKEGL